MNHTTGIQSEEEQALLEEAKELFGELFDVLDSQNLLRKTTIPIDRDKLKKIWINTIHFGDTFNEISRKFKEFRSKDELADFASKIGIRTQTLSYLFLSQTLSTLLIYYESLLRTSLLFFLEEEQNITRELTLGKLLYRIEIISPSIGKKLKKMIDSDLRNILAHGNFWFEKDGLHYAENSYLEENNLVTVKQLRSRVGKVGIVARALIQILGERIRRGDFKP